MAKAMEIADATGEISAQRLREGYDRLDAIRASTNEPWLSMFMRHHLRPARNVAAQLRERGPELCGTFRAVRSDAVLRNLDVPQLWILGSDDTDAPSAETVRRLRALALRENRSVTAVFPHADHGIYEYETRADGTRVRRAIQRLFRDDARFHPP